MSRLTELLASPEVQATLDAIAQAAAPEATPQDPKNIARAMAMMERDKHAAAIRAALETLGKTPAVLERATWLETQAQTTPAAQPTELPSTPSQDAKTIESTQETTDTEKTQEKRGGKREGAGRKPTADGTDKATGKMIALYPHEWERLDNLATSMNTNRSGVIRAALDALEATQNA